MEKLTQETDVKWSPASMLEIYLAEPDDFRKVRETLTRIGIAPKHEKKLFQSCHILHKQGRYFIVHFKELFLLDNKKSNLTEGDIQRKNTIARLLCDWGLLEIVKDDTREYAPMNEIKIINYRDKENWELVPKYKIGSN
jgi:hypothetical protein